MSKMKKMVVVMDGRVDEPMIHTAHAWLYEFTGRIRETYISHTTSEGYELTVISNVELTVDQVDDAAQMIGNEAIQEDRGIRFSRPEGGIEEKLGQYSQSTLHYLGYMNGYSLDSDERYTG